MNPIREHWNDVWSTKPHETVSWYQAEPERSVALVDRIGVGEDDDVIDVGCGASHLADVLLGRGVRTLHLLDISIAAMEHMRRRLDGVESGTEVLFHGIDVLDLEPVPSVSLWHDRAALHFLGDPTRRARYASRAAEGVRTGGHLIIGGFAPDGPTRCSDLDVHRSGPEELAELFAPAFALVSSEEERHETPWGSTQAFQWCVFERLA